MDMDPIEQAKMINDVRKKCKPWSLEDVPVGVVVMREDKTAKGTIVCANEDDVFINGITATPDAYTYQEVLDDWLVQLPTGFTIAGIQVRD
jgi:hypothetical protein